VRIVAFLGAAVGAVTLSLEAATGAGTASTQAGGTFRAAVIAGWASAIDPALTASSADAAILAPACGNLLAYPDRPLPRGGRLEPELAQAMPVVSADRRRYTFSIRQDARFSTGAPVTARDVVHTLERIFSPAMKSTYPDFYLDIIGARAMLEGRATTLAGVAAKGRTLTIRLTKPLPDFPARMTLICVVPANLPVDPEGAKAPIPSAAPYYFAQYVPGEQVVLERNRFYRGQRPRHVARITIDLAANASAVDQVARGELDTVLGTPDLNPRLPDIVGRYGVNKGRFFRQPGLATRMFFLNTSRPLFRNNARLRQALNFAVDRKALTREFGQHAATTTDQYFPPAIPGFRDERIYPLSGPNLERARALARGHTRSGKAVLYTCARPDCLAAAQILQKNVRPLGLEIEIKQFPTTLFFEKSIAPNEPVDIMWIGWSAAWNDPLYFMTLFDGRTVNAPGTSNYSRFRSPSFDRLVAEAESLRGDARTDAYGELEVKLVREAAPAIAYANGNSWAFVSARTGCVVLNPFFVLSAVCLK
jgi:ABC-type transport system substrate-binding protein